MGRQVMVLKIFSSKDSKKEISPDVDTDVIKSVRENNIFKYADDSGWVLQESIKVLVDEKHSFIGIDGGYYYVGKILNEGGAVSFATFTVGGEEAKTHELMRAFGEKIPLFWFSSLSDPFEIISSIRERRRFIRIIRRIKNGEDVYDRCRHYKPKEGGNLCEDDYGYEYKCVLEPYAEYREERRRETYDECNESEDEIAENILREFSKLPPWRKQSFDRILYRCVKEPGV